jgi:Holliday junction resolvase RusA-like endonuclease
MIDIISSPNSAPTIQCSSPFFSGRMPLPPGINHSYRPDGRSIRATRALRQFKRDAALTLANTDTTYRDWEVIQKIREAVTNPPHKHTPIAMRIRIFSKTLWRYDIDGLEKAVIDAVFERIELARYDNLIVNKLTTKEIDRSDPRIEVELRCIVK